MPEVKAPQTLPRPEPGEALTIGEAAARSGVSVHTLCYYERAGLIVTTVERNHAGRRRYHEAHLEWIEICTRLRTTGMPIRTIRRYAALVAVGSGNEDERRALMESHRALVKAKLDKIEENLKLIDYTTRSALIATASPLATPASSGHPPSPESCRHGERSRGRPGPYPGQHGWWPTR